MKILFATLLVASPSLAQNEAHWPAWRGPAGNGVASTEAPTKWSDEENVRWMIELPGRGMSTPIVWGERLYLTTAVPTGEAPEVEPEPEEEGGGRGFRRVPLREQSYEVHCYDRNTGELVWRQVATVETPHEGYHATYGSWASAAPITNGEQLFVSFGSQGIYAYDLDGELSWKQELGVQLRMRNAFGEGHAPVLAGDALVLVCDQEDQSFVVALDRETGKELWRQERDEPSAWATPLVTEHGGRLQVVTSGTNRVRSYDPTTGEILWECGGIGLNAIPAVLRLEDTVIAMSGYREANIVAIELGGEGDLTGSDSVAWTSAKGCAYTASPVLHDGLYYTVTDRGFISCFDALGGDALYVEERLPRGSTLKSSPIAAGELLYVPTEAGEVHVIKLGPDYEVVRTNSLTDQVFVASPIVVDGDLILRSVTHLICVSDKTGG